MKKLFALFQNESDARCAIASLRQHGDDIGSFAATIGPHPTLGTKASLHSTPPDGAVGRWSVLFGAFLGATLGAAVAGPLGLILTPIAKAVGIGALAGGLLSVVAGWIVGRAFPDRNGPTPSRYCTHDKVVLKVGLDDDANEHVVRTMLGQHGARRIVVSVH